MIQVLFFIFLLVPFVEIYLLIKIGGVIGALPTVFLVVLTALIGAFLLRLQGFATLQRVRVSLGQGELPAIEMLEGVILLISGALLLTPGFFTDVIGFTGLIPTARQWLARLALERFLVLPGGHTHRGEHHDAPRTFEGEYRRDD